KQHKTRSCQKMEYFEENRRNLDKLTGFSQTCLLNVFHEHYPRKPKDLCKALSQPNEIRKLDELKKKKVLRTDQYELIYPSDRKTNSEMFDITLVFLLIRTLCGYKAPRNGWSEMPDKTEETKIAHCLTLKILRNEIQHLPRRELDTTKYREFYNKMRRSLIALGCSRDQITIFAPSHRSAEARITY
uniref:DZIP3-like HEPN domain-containing protein n=1 Tax=Clytia hemisphaerica TaxID=252671 RepID=A0A7M5WQD9_9CNID